MEFLITPADRREYYDNIQALRKIRAAFAKNAAVELQSVEHPDNVIIFSRDKERRAEELKAVCEFVKQCIGIEIRLPDKIGMLEYEAEVKGGMDSEN